MADTPTISRIPIQLFEAVCILFIFAILLFAEHKSSTTPLLRLYLGAYVVCRFILEFYRGDALRGLWLGLSTSQWVSLAILGYLIVSIFCKKRKTGRKNTASMKKGKIA